MKKTLLQRRFPVQMLSLSVIAYHANSSLDPCPMYLSLAQVSFGREELRLHTVLTEAFRSLAANGFLQTTRSHVTGLENQEY